MNLKGQSGARIRKRGVHIASSSADLKPCPPCPPSMLLRPLLRSQSPEAKEVRPVYVGQVQGWGKLWAEPGTAGMALRRHQVEGRMGSEGSRKDLTRRFGERHLLGECVPSARVWEAGGGDPSTGGMAPFLSDLMGESKV